VIVISARVLPAAVEIHLAPEPPVFTNLSPEKNLEIQNSLSVASELGQLSGGRLLTGPSGAPAGSHTPPTDEAPPKDMWPFPIQLVLPALEQFPVLVVDDNEDGLHLLKRYAAGTRYHLVCTRDTDLVATLVETVHPQIIVLDLMMPKENGWLVLGRLRQHPLTRSTPIIICTILPQEQLALSLGASAFLKKPVSRQAFLQALDQQFSLLEPESP
jgi:CheY-like chemotaxis protein